MAIPHPHLQLEHRPAVLDRERPASALRGQVLPWRARGATSSGRELQAPPPGARARLLRGHRLHSHRRVLGRRWRAGLRGGGVACGPGSGRDPAPGGL